MPPNGRTVGQVCRVEIFVVTGTGGGAAWMAETELLFFFCVGKSGQTKSLSHAFCIPCSILQEVIEEEVSPGNRHNFIPKYLPFS